MNIYYSCCSIHACFACSSLSSEHGTWCTSVQQKKTHKFHTFQLVFQFVSVCFAFISYNYKKMENVKRILFSMVFYKIFSHFHSVFHSVLPAHYAHLSSCFLFPLTFIYNFLPFFFLAFHALQKRILSKFDAFFPPRVTLFFWDGFLLLWICFATRKKRIRFSKEKADAWVP